MSWWAPFAVRRWGRCAPEYHPPPMRRLLATLLILPILTIAGCGGGDDSSPLDAALRYLPKDASFAAALDTDPSGEQFKALGALLDKFPFGDQIKGSLLQQFEQSAGGVRYEQDVKPVLGNPLVVGAASGDAITGGSGAFVVAIQAKDEGALDDLIAKTKPKKTGEASGATLYSDGGSVFAVENDMVVFASDEAQLKKALERADGDSHFDENAFNDGLDGLPDSALARVYADVETLLKSDPASADALRVKWIAALRTLGLTVTAQDSSLDVDFRLRTDGDLGDADLPIAPGDDAPPVIKRQGEVGFGVRGLAHIVHFAESAGQSIDPAGFGDYAKAKTTIDKQLGVSLDDDLIGQLTGNVSASVALDGGFGVRADLEDARAFERTLAKVADVLPSFAEGAGFGTVTLSKPDAGNRFYELAKSGGGSVVFGVVGDVLVVASDRARAEDFASATPAEVAGASGSVVLGADAEQLVQSLIESFGPAFGIPDVGALGTGLLTRPLGELGGHASASPDELRGKFTLAIE
ncbi:MAG: hypothetical protein QOE69_1316 [Thermoleophilaceae bacterium]|nr:hypothetical protein [Thermoleophilaceae bacterium]